MQTALLFWKLKAGPNQSSMSHFDLSPLLQLQQSNSTTVNLCYIRTTTELPDAYRIDLTDAK